MSGLCVIDQHGKGNDSKVERFIWLTVSEKSVRRGKGGVLGLLAVRACEGCSSDGGSSGNTAGLEPRLNLLKPAPGASLPPSGTHLLNVPQFPHTVPPPKEQVRKAQNMSLSGEFRFKPHQRVLAGQRQTG